MINPNEFLEKLEQDNADAYLNMTQSNNKLPYIAVQLYYTRISAINKLEDGINPLLVEAELLNESNNIRDTPSKGITIRTGNN